MFTALRSDGVGDIEGGLGFAVRDVQILLSGPPLQPPHPAIINQVSKWGNRKTMPLRPI